RDEARQNAHRRRFSGAIRAEKADHFAAADLEAHLVERANGAEPLRERARLDHDVGTHPTSHRVDRPEGRGTRPGATGRPGTRGAEPRHRSGEGISVNGVPSSGTGPSVTRTNSRLAKLFPK